MNWGKKIVLGMAVFMLFILGMGARMIFSNKDDLVETDYYEKGQHYESDYDEQQNALGQAGVPRINVSAGKISVTFPESCTYSIWCRHPFDASLDLDKSGHALAGEAVSLTETVLPKGNWNVEVTWTSAGVTKKIKQHVVIR